MVIQHSTVYLHSISSSCADWQEFPERPYGYNVMSQNFKTEKELQHLHI
jgi:hypothetical protein